MEAALAPLYNTLYTTVLLLEHVLEVVASMRGWDPLLCGLKIAAAIRNPLLTLAATLGLAIAGLWAWRHVPVDALPDLSDNQVIVWAEWPGQSPQDMDLQVTARLTRELQGLAGVQTVRGMSLYGASYLYVIFEERRDLYECRTRVLERLAQLQGVLPPGVTPRISARRISRTASRFPDT